MTGDMYFYAQDTVRLRRGRTPEIVAHVAGLLAGRESEEAGRFGTRGELIARAGRLAAGPRSEKTFATPEADYWNSALWNARRALTGIATDDLVVAGLRGMTD